MSAPTDNLELDLERVLRERAETVEGSRDPTAPVRDRVAVRRRARRRRRGMVVLGAVVACFVLAGVAVTRVDRDVTVVASPSSVPRTTIGLVPKTKPKVAMFGGSMAL